MFLHSRALRWGRAVASNPVELPSIPSEPLLFLYPRWVRTTSHPAHHHTSGKDSDQQAPRGPFWADEDSANPESEDLDRLSSVISSIESNLQRLEPTVWAQPNAKKGDQNEPSHDENQTSSRQGLVRTPQKKKGSRIFQVAKILAHKEEAREARSSYDKMVREQIRRNAHKAKTDHLADWRAILRKLELYTPPHPEASRERAWKSLMVPLATVEQLIISVDHNIWMLKQRYGCEIELAEQQESFKFREVIVSGTLASIADACAEIRQMSKEEIQPTRTKHINLPGFSTKSSMNRSARAKDGGAKIARNVISKDREAMTSPIPVYRVKRPTFWTKESFTEYVRHITSIKIPSHMQSYLYERGRSHADHVLDILHKLFTDRDCEAHITLEALHDTMEYLVKHSQLQDLRALYVRMQMININMNTETYNIMLRSAAKHKDLHAFHYIFDLMLQRGHQPNGETWIAFVRMLLPTEVKKLVIAAMRKKGFLNNPRLLKDACAQVVFREISISLDNEFSMGNFLEHMEATYGKYWLGIESANRILNALGSRGLISVCLDFLTYMEHNGVIPDSVSLGTIIHNCTKISNARYATMVLEHISSLVNVAVDPFTYQALFSLAGHYRFYNMARVVWQYACLDGATTFLMRKRVKNAVKAAVFKDFSTGPATVRDFWNHTMGPFIIGFGFLFPPWRPLPDRYYPKTHLEFNSDQEPNFNDGFSSDLESSPENEVDSDLESSPENESDPDHKSELNYFNSSLSHLAWPPENATPERMAKYEEALNQIRLDMGAFRFWQPNEPLSAALKTALLADISMHNVWRDPDGTWYLPKFSPNLSLVSRGEILPVKVAKWVPMCPPGGSAGDMITHLPEIEGAAKEQKRIGDPDPKSVTKKPTGKKEKRIWARKLIWKIGTYGIRVVRPENNLTEEAAGTKAKLAITGDGETGKDAIIRRYHF